jgi:eight-cysteine-cluster-containing protein
MLGLGACAPGPVDDQKLGNKTLQLTRQSDGSMQYCDSAGTCQALPYGGDCVTLEITIDTATGNTCEKCILADGSTGYESCGASSVACVLVTLPEPDCVVCAYVNGAVLFSSCVSAEPACSTHEDCDAQPGIGYCFDGQCVYEPGCIDSFDCPVGFRCQTDAWGQGVCIPGNDGCQSDYECPAGMVCRVECWDCAAGDAKCAAACQGVCVPAEGPTCDNIKCAPGEHCEMQWVECFVAPCVPVPVCVPDVVQCYSDADCYRYDGAAGYCQNGVCIYDNGCRGDMDCPAGYKCEFYDYAGSDTNGDGMIMPPSYGQCVPMSPCWSNAECPAGYECAFYKADETGNADRMPIYEGGVCVPVQVNCQSDAECPTGYHCEYYYPVPGTDGAGGSSGSGAQMPAPPPYGVCVQDQLTCTSDYECPTGMVCDMICPPCDPAMGMPCAQECWGTCVPAPVECYSDYDCKDASGMLGRCINNVCWYDAGCISDQDCPAGFKCEYYTGTGAGGSAGAPFVAAGQCVPNGGGCEPACPPDMVCQVECTSYCAPGDSYCQDTCYGKCVPVAVECYVDNDCWDPTTGAMGRCIANACVFDAVCYSDYDCAPGMKCQYFSGRPGGMCVWDGVYCYSDQDCGPGMMCQVVCWECAPNDPTCQGGCQGVCTPMQLTCNDIECPPGFACEMSSYCFDPTMPCEIVPVCVPQVVECYSDIDCITATLPEMGKCIDNKCVYQVNCDTRQVLCEIAVTECPAGLVHSVSGVCYGPCVDPRVCAPIDCMTQDCPSGWSCMWGSGMCAPNAYPFPTCDDVVCPPGSHCEMQFPNCSVPGCDPKPVCMPDYTECSTDADCERIYGVPGTCINGYCQLAPVETNCDARFVACDALPPECPPGLVPSVVGMCWGPCVKPETCAMMFCDMNYPCPAPFECLYLMNCASNDPNCLGAGVCNYIAPPPPPGCSSDADCPAGFVCEWTNCDPTAYNCAPYGQCVQYQNPTCADVVCAPGTHCEMQQVWCFMAPCPEMPICVPDYNGECKTDAECGTGFQCVFPDCDATTGCLPYGKCVPIPTPVDCYRTGCSGQVCADHDVVTSCEYLEQYACLDKAICQRQADGQCGWTITPDAAICLGNTGGWN